VPKLVTFNDYERRNGCVISPNLVDFGTDYVEVVEDTPILSAAEMEAKESSLQRNITYGDIGRGSGTSLSLAES